VEAIGLWALLSLLEWIELKNNHHDTTHLSFLSFFFVGGMDPLNSFLCDELVEIANVDDLLVFISLQRTC